MERITNDNKIKKASVVFSQIQKFVEKELSIRVESIKQIKKGRNSQVFLIEEDEKKWIVKKYYRHSGDERNRLETETSFLNYLKDIGLKTVAKPLAIEIKNNLGLFSFLPGKVPKRINKEIILQVNDFIKEINEFRNEGSTENLPLASEASFSIFLHLKLVKTRIEKLHKIDLSQSIQKEVLSFVKGNLVEALEKISNDIKKNFSEIECKNLLPHESRILSPSDFGFQNMLLEENNLYFLDFEYAGWDDPAKLICDFGCHPEIPVEDKYLQLFKDSFYSWFDEAKLAISRSEMLMNLYRLRWCCIILNIFTAIGKERSVYTGEIESYEKQYYKSKKYYERYLT